MTGFRLSAICILSYALCINVPCFAQTSKKPVTKIDHVVQQDKTVAFTVTSSRPFIVGNNLYILHIGDQSFSHSLQSTTKDRTGTMTFYIPISDYERLAENSDIYLSYGQSTISGKGTTAADCEQSGLCWVLGTFTRTLLQH
jgi:3',5'-cyclic AMP phosphodiesterase CpdA